MNNPEQTHYPKPTQDYLRVMTATPETSIADPLTNAFRINEVYAQARGSQAELLVLPELSITAYSAADLFHNDHVLKMTEGYVSMLAQDTLEGPAMVVGAPLRKNGILYNCAVMLAEGEIKGVVPKSYLPNYNEFYEKRWFTSGKSIVNQDITIGEQTVAFGTDILFEVNGTKVGVEICEDGWAPVPTGAEAALQGAEVIVNLSASNELIGKDSYRRMSFGATAGRLICAHVYTSAGEGESNADVIYGGHQMIHESGRLVAERKPHAQENSLVYDIDSAYINHDRAVNKTFADQALEHQTQNSYRVVKVSAPKPTVDLYRKVDPYPYVPSNQETRSERCQEIINNLARAYAQRLKEIDSKSIVLGLSGGLDSTLGLIIAAEATHILGKKNNFIHTITMPGFASSDRTQDNATLLAKALDTTHKIMPIGNLANTLLETIGHDQESEDVTYENAQARMRTNILMNYANMIGGLAQGTGDVSESMQGWCTYNGDHMSMFNPNSSVPKTLVAHLVSWYADTLADKDASKIIEDILDTPISPELTGGGDLTQTTEDIIGPYELHDFFTNEHLRHGTEFVKIAYLAKMAFKETYSEDTIGKWLTSFFKRHTASQWKREALPNGTKIGTTSVSPRGDLRMAPNTSPNWYM